MNYHPRFESFQGSIVTRSEVFATTREAILYAYTMGEATSMPGMKFTPRTEAVPVDLPVTHRFEFIDANNWDVMEVLTNE